MLQDAFDWRTVLWHKLEGLEPDWCDQSVWLYGLLRLVLACLIATGCSEEYKLDEKMEAQSSLGRQELCFKIIKTGTPQNSKKTVDII